MNTLQINIILSVLTVLVIIWAEIWYANDVYDDVVNTRFVVSVALLSAITTIRWLKYKTR